MIAATAFSIGLLFALVASVVGVALYRAGEDRGARAMPAMRYGEHVRLYDHCVQDDGVVVPRHVAVRWMVQPL